MLYLLESSNYYKIGHTTNLDKRFLQYVTHNPEFKLLDTCNGDENVEQLCHKSLRDKIPYKNEWYEKSPAVLAIWEFAKNLNKPNKTIPEKDDIKLFMNNDDFYCLSKAESNVLGVCWYMSQYYGEDSQIPGNIVQYNGLLLKVIIDKTKLSESSIKHAFMSLCKKEMLIKGKERGIYYLNPKYFFKGKISDRMKALEVTIKYLISE